MADKDTKSDPTVKSGTTTDAGAEGWHEARPVSEAADAAANKQYAENKDKPDKTTIAQVEVLDD